MKRFYTYLHCKPDGTPFYVGKGTGTRCYDTTKRSDWHRRIVAKYGRPNIKIYVFPCESDAVAIADEITWIAQLRADGYELCNMTDGGEGVTGGAVRRGFKLSDVTREKISKSLIGNTRSVGRVHSDEVRKKIAAANRAREYPTGHTLSAEHKAKIGAGQLGLVRTDETRQKMSKTRKGRRQERLTCPHCNLEGGAQAMRRYHFDKCKVQHA